MNSSKSITQMIRCLFLAAFLMMPFLGSAEAEPGWALFQEETPDTVTAPADTPEDSSPDTSRTGQKQQPPSIRPRTPVATAADSGDTVEQKTEVAPPPDTSAIAPPDTARPAPAAHAPTISPRDTSAAGRSPDTTAAGEPGDTTALSPMPADTTQVLPPEADSTAASPADTMFGKTYLAFVGETMFIHQRSAPFPATYTYKYAGIDGDSTFRVNLTTKFMQQSYRSHFRFPLSSNDTLDIGPFEVLIGSADSTSLVFEMLGYARLPEPEIPERVEPVAEATQPAETKPQALPQLVKKESPATAVEFFSRGYLRAADEKYDQAVEDLRTALDMDSTLTDARLLLGWVLTEKGDSAAIETLQECAMLKPGDVTASFFLAYGLDRSGFPEEALESYAMIVETDSSHARALFRLASLYQGQGDSVKAVELLDKARGVKADIDSASAVPSPWDIPHEFRWADTWPQLTHYEKPVFPDSARADSLEGRVTVGLLVDEDGKPARVEIHQPSEHEVLNTAAEAAAWKCTFTPPTHHDRPIRLWVALPYLFERPPEEVKPATAAAISDSPVTNLEAASDSATAAPPAEVRPKLLRLVQPDYPPEAMADSLEMTVVLNVLVGTDGSVKDVMFVDKDTLNEAFNTAAEAAARQSRFQPGQRGGKPDTMWVELPVTFSPAPTPDQTTLVPPPGRPAPPEGERPAPQLPARAQEKASAYVQGMMLAQQGNYDEALALIHKSLETDPKDENSQILYGLILLARETGQRMDEVADLAGQPEKGVYWWTETMPQMEEFNEATYPDEAKAAGHEGTVILYVLVDEEGAVQSIKVVAPAEDSSLTAAAEGAAKGCSFTPGTLSGEPVKVWTRLPYEFTIED